jgi:hypothetical protein
MRLAAVVFRLAPEPPCDKFSCKHRKECKEKRLACYAFDKYVRTGRALDPRFVLEKQEYGIYPSILILAKVAKPTSTVYQAIFDVTKD